MAQPSSTKLPEDCRCANNWNGRTTLSAARSAVVRSSNSSSCAKPCGFMAGGTVAPCLCAGHPAKRSAGSSVWESSALIVAICTFCAVRYRTYEDIQVAHIADEVRCRALIFQNPVD